MLHELGVAEATDRQRDRFDAHLRQAMAAVRETHMGAEIALDLGRARASVGDFRAAAEVLEEALRSLEDPECDLGEALESELMAMGFHEFTSTQLAAPHWERRLTQLRR